MFGSNFDVFQEVIVEDEIQEINVESSSNSPVSGTNDIYSNENSVSSYAASESFNKYWTREDLTPSKDLPDNLFMENEDEINSFGLDPTADVNVSLNDGAGFGLTTLFPIKEEPCENEEAKPGDNAVEKNVKKATRRKIKQEPNDSDAAPKYYTLSYIKLFVDIISHS